MMSSPLSSLSSPGSCDYSGPATTCHYETRLNNKHSSTLLATLGKKNPLFEEHEGQQRTEGVLSPPDSKAGRQDLGGSRLLKEVVAVVEGSAGERPGGF